MVEFTAEFPPTFAKISANISIEISAKVLRTNRAKLMVMLPLIRLLVMSEPPVCACHVRSFHLTNFVERLTEVA